MAKQERSAGVIVFLQNPDQPRQYLLLDYGKHWDFPKGHVEKGETDTQAALRELEEETGLRHPQLKSGFSHEIEYFFRNHRGVLIRKVVWFCLGRVEKATVQLSHEHVGYDFLPYEQALARLTYAGAKGLLKEAESFLNASP